MAQLSAAMAPALLTQPASVLDEPPPRPSAIFSTSNAGLSDSPLLPPQLGDSSLSSSPRSRPFELSHPILEEGDESESDSPNEPVTPVSGRQSQDFHVLRSHEHHQDAAETSTQSSSDPTPTTYTPIQPGPPTYKDSPPVIRNTPATPSPRPVESNRRPSLASPPATSASADSSLPPLTRRSTQGSTTSLFRTFSNNMSGIFKRSASQSDKAAFGLTNVPKSDSQLHSQQNQPPSRSFTGQTSIATTQTNSPGSPGSPPLEMAGITKAQTVRATVPNHVDFFNNNVKKKNRASTGLSLHNVFHKLSTKPSKVDIQVQPPRRRASSFDRARQPAAATDGVQPALSSADPWGLAPNQGTGIKARRLSLSLPDDFTVDIADLHDEYEYVHKLGRHRKALGKGDSSKVYLMYRKGCEKTAKGEFSELVACKEFRAKTSRETKEEYDKKVKSEYSLGKSLVHPNIIETIRLCTDHGRWNHVMEYCGAGDLHSLLEKNYLKMEDREKDRFCLFKQLIQGLNYLHSHGIAHRDIKCENLLITKDSKLKISDFGVSEVFCGIHPGLREAGGQCGVNLTEEIRLCGVGICGSLPFIAPEVLAKQASYDPRKVDVWSAGIIMLYLIFGGGLWGEARVGKPGGQYYDQLVKAWEKWEAKPRPEGDTSTGPKEPTDTDYPRVRYMEEVVHPRVLRRLLLQMLHPNPDRRLTMEQVANTRWVRNIECCQPDSYEDPKVVIDATKKSCARVNGGGTKIYCHNHLPLQTQYHGLGKMPGQVGY